MSLWPRSISIALKKYKNTKYKNRHLRPLPRRPPPLPPPTPFPLAKDDPTRRWTSQFKMMDRLLALKKPIRALLPATSPKRAEADIKRMDRHQRGVQSPGRHLRGHDTETTDRGSPRQPTDVHHDRGYRDAQRGIPPNEDTERHRLATPTGRHPHRIDPGSGAYLGGARRAGSTAGGDGRQRCVKGLTEGGASVRVAESEAKAAWRPPARERLCSPQDPRRRGLEGDDCRVSGCTDAAVRACAGASVGRGAHGTCTQEEEAIETRGTVRSTCESDSRWWW